MSTSPEPASSDEPAGADGIVQRWFGGRWWIPVIAVAVFVVIVAIMIVVTS